jgi:hypothetical protein
VLVIASCFLQSRARWRAKMLQTFPPFVTLCTTHSYARDTGLLVQKALEKQYLTGILNLTYKRFKGPIFLGHHHTDELTPKEETDRAS